MLSLLRGRLGSIDIEWTEGHKDGMIPLHTIDNDIDFSRAELKTTNLGIKVWVCFGDYWKKVKIINII